MNIVTALKYPFRGENWFTKIAAQGLVIIIPIIGAVAWFGYIAQIIGDIADGCDEDLPNWDFGKNIASGFMIAVAYVVFSAPAYCLVLVGGEMRNELLNGIFIFMALTIALIVGLFLMVGVIRFAVTESFGSFFLLGANLALILNHLPTIIITYLIALVSSFVWMFAAALSAITFCGPFFVTGYYSIFIAHILGQLGVKMNIHPLQDKPNPTGQFR